MGEIEGTYRVLQTPGSRLGVQKNSGVSTLEPGQNISSAMVSTSPRTYERSIQIKVKLLDNTQEVLDIESKCCGQKLLTEIFSRLNLVESDYFGIEFQNLQSYWIWLEPMKPIVKQVRRPKNTVLRLAVKFFPPDPGQLQEEYTRYLFALQMKRDLAEERLTCNDNTAALLVLEIGRKLEMYGMRFHLASDREGTKINLAVSNMGVLVFQGNIKINTFNWSKIRKISFKRKRFLIKLHPEVHGPYQDTLEFLLGGRDECKNLWKICVEYHTFFRLSDQPKPKPKPVFFSRGSSFRYSGRTQKQLVDYVRESGLKKIPYERRHSKTRMSGHTLSPDAPKQSISFTEGLRIPASNACTYASFHMDNLLPSNIASLSSLTESNSFFLEPRMSHGGSLSAEGNSIISEETGKKVVQQPASPNLQSFQGVGICNVEESCNPICSDVENHCALEIAVEKYSKEGRITYNNDNDEDDDFTTSMVIAGKQRRLQGRDAPLVKLVSSQLHVSEEFIDDDPAEISFFAGGSEAFSYLYDGLDLKDSNLSKCLSDSPTLTKEMLQQNMVSSHSSPDRYSIEAVDMNVDDEFEFEGDSDFNGNQQPSDTSELFEVKAQASRMQSLLSPSETSSLINNQSESSSLNNLTLNGTPFMHTYSSANQSEASSMVNFPAYSVRSESSSALQFTDIIDQLEQLSYPPTTTEDSSSSDDSWDSESAPPLDINLFFSNPFAQATLSSFKVKSAVSLSPPLQETVIQGSSPLLSPVLSDVSGARFEEEDEMKHKKCPTDKAYFIAKEILATERTYLKDLEVLTLWFRSAVVKENAMPEGLMTLFFSNIDPIYEFHRGFLKELEQRLALWEGRSSSGKGDYQRIGDVMLRNVQILKEFTNYLQKHDEVLMELEKATKRIKKLEIVYKEFELQRVCYLPLNTFLLKPIHRIIYYKLILGRLCKHYPADHRDYTDCKNALKEIADMTSQLQNSLIRLENFQKLIELQHDLLGTDNLIAPGRFSDTLLYTSKGVTGTNQFKIRGHLPLHGMLLIVLDPPVEESENEWSVPHCFTIYSAQKTVVVAASTRLEMEKWLEDLNMAIEMAKKTVEKSGMFLENSLSNRSNRSSDEVSLEQESEEDIHSSRSSLDRQSHHRANTTIHVCWYRNTSVSMTDHKLPPRYLLGQTHRPNTITHVCWYRNQSLSLSDYLCMIQNQLSGYLLRKFKNSNGWQKLWVVFTNFCLFFYKTHQVGGSNKESHKFSWKIQPFDHKG
ncbi:FERM, RhoGEF and pleckstrin domain-containing protein 1 [Ophiophagus hannah]|uniref:FERM, RhoGEF and pleckstrin domain-containing protein 1 n=1 Tax=Ophiophagus hannah TaxID=8665 RepID=V8NJW7_OPHHA|nr:FERM, RhoGEF and pleckstrin domain-containing protein 1 [Ophiophagus hannah]